MSSRERKTSAAPPNSDLVRRQVGVPLTRVKKDRAKAAAAVRRGAPNAPGAALVATRRTRIDHQGFAIGADDTPIYYRVSGVADAPTVILSDGIGCDGYIWKYLERALAEHYRVIHWHYRGHG